MALQRRVLVVEDNAAMGNVIRFNLQAAGLDAELARNGAEAWEILAESQFDLIVTDYQMPIMDGRSLCLKLRESDRFRGVPIILLTAKEMELNTWETIDELGLVCICPKPFSPSELTERVLGLLNALPA